MTVNDPLLEMQPIEEEQGAAGEKHAHTHGKAMAAMILIWLRT